MLANAAATKRPDSEKVSQDFARNRHLRYVKRSAHIPPNSVRVRVTCTGFRLADSGLRGRVSQTRSIELVARRRGKRTVSVDEEAQFALHPWVFAPDGSEGAAIPEGLLRVGYEIGVLKQTTR